MNKLAALNVRSILVTSGTLSPLPSYSLELGLPFPQTIENEHIISKEQISVHVIGKGVSGKALTSTYNQRNDIEYITELGNTIISLTRVIPNGVLIFFPSYSVMETCIEKWAIQPHLDLEIKAILKTKVKATSFKQGNEITVMHLQVHHCHWGLDNIVSLIIHFRLGLQT